MFHETKAPNVWWIMVVKINTQIYINMSLSTQFKQFNIYILFPASLMAQTVKCLPTMRETWVQSLGREDLLEKEMAPHSSTLAWRIPWTEEPGRLQSIGSLRVGHDWATSVSVLPLSCIGEGNGNPLQCSCLENPRDGGVWWAAVYGVAQSQTRLKWLSSRPYNLCCNYWTLSLKHESRHRQYIN